MFANVKIIEDENNFGKVSLHVNDCDISGITRSINAKVGVGCVPTVTVELFASPFEYKGNADVRYDFTPDSVNEAVRIVKTELSKKGDAYEELIDKIDKAISKASVEITRALHYAESLDLAESASESVIYTARCVANALLGLEE